ncbi:MAG: hypothetical protein ACOYMN_10095 [Roseimicrobium sp.]
MTTAALSPSELRPLLAQEVGQLPDDQVIALHAQVRKEMAVGR